LKRLLRCARAAGALVHSAAVFAPINSISKRAEKREKTGRVDEWNDDLFKASWNHFNLSVAMACNGRFLLQNNGNPLGQDCGIQAKCQDAAWGPVLEDVVRKA